MDPKHVQIGSPFREFPGGSFNALVDGHNNQRAQRQPPSGKPNSTGPAAIIQIRNDSGADMTPGAVLGIDGPAFTYAEDEKQVYSPPVLKGIVPTTAAHATKFAITKEWILDGKVGAAVIPGAAWALVDVTSAGHTHAKVKNSTAAHLESGTTGYPFIYKELELLISGAEQGVQWALLLVSGAGTPASENYRRIRGQAVGAVLVSDTDFLIDNVIVLAGGIDPSGGNPATQVAVANIYGDAFADNASVTADYSPSILTSPTVDWEANHTVEGAETYRLCRAAVKGAVTPQANTFIVDGVVPRAGGLDPVAGNAATELLVFKDPSDNWHEDLYDNEIVVILYAPGVFTGCDWELLFVERFREGRGKCTAAVASSATDFNVDEVVILCSGRDPRTDPTSVSETLLIKNIPQEAHTIDEEVWFTFRCDNNTWEARPSAVATKFVCLLSADLPAGSIASPSSVSATVYRIGPNAATTSLGTKTVYNHQDYIKPVEANGYYCDKNPGSDNYTVTSDHIPAWLRDQSGWGAWSLGAPQVFGHIETTGLFGWKSLQCETLVQSVDCVDGEVTGTDDTFYVIPCTP